MTYDLGGGEAFLDAFPQRGFSVRYNEVNHVAGLHDSSRPHDHVTRIEDRKLALWHHPIYCKLAFSIAFAHG
jgi:hypothetical protein